MCIATKKKYTPVLSSLGKLLTQYYLLLYKSLQINFEGNFYDLIKNLYYNSTSSVRTGDSQTKPFQYVRCSPRLHFKPTPFNLYINDFPYSFGNILSDPFVLPNGIKLSFPLYPDKTKLDRTKLVMFGSRQMTAEVSQFRLFLLGKELEPVEAARALGITLYSNLTYNEYIVSTFSSCMAKLTALSIFLINEP